MVLILYSGVYLKFSIIQNVFYFKEEREHWALILLQQKRKMKLMLLEDSTSLVLSVLRFSFLKCKFHEAAMNRKHRSL